MITDKTVLVLGAGASEHVGFPLGNNLAKEMITSLSIDGHFYKILALMKYNMDDVHSLRTLLSSSDINTPDFLLASNPQLIELGTLAIAWVIGIHERREHLKRGLVDDDYLYKYIWNKLHTVDINELCKNQLKIITFNYERSLEEYLLSEISSAYQISRIEAFDILNGMIDIVHVHGKIGEYSLHDEGVLKQYQPSWFNDLDHTTVIERDRLKQTASLIKIATQASSSEPEFKQAQKWLSDAECVIFLGCAYHAMNMENLRVNEFLNTKTRIFACTYLLGRGEIISNLSLLSDLKFPDGTKPPSWHGSNNIVIGNPSHKATQFLKESVWFDTQPHTRTFIDKLLP